MGDRGECVEQFEVQADRVLYPPVQIFGELTVLDPEMADLRRA
ncbi:hypothetical protein ABZS81_28355 [Streptomyces sp. NPDC005318]